MTPDRIKQLNEEWRHLADTVRAYGADLTAIALQRCAEDLLHMVEADDDVVTLAEAARESGYSADHLGRLLKRGDLKNYGRPHAPRLRRSELPKKVSGKRPAEAPVGSTLPAALVKSAFNARRRAS